MSKEPVPSTTEREEVVRPITYREGQILPDTSVNMGQKSSFYVFE